MSMWCMCVSMCVCAYMWTKIQRRNTQTSSALNPSRNVCQYVVLRLFIFQCVDAPACHVKLRINNIKYRLNFGLIVSDRLFSMTSGLKKAMCFTSSSIIHGNSSLEHLSYCLRIISFLHVMFEERNRREIIFLALINLFHIKVIKLSFYLHFQLHITAVWLKTWNLFLSTFGLFFMLTTLPWGFIDTFMI